MNKYDEKIKKLKEDKKRAKAMKAWRARFDALKKKNGKQLKQFCDQHGFDDSHLIHQMAGRRNATPAHFAAVNKALKEEGV